MWLGFFIRIFVMVVIDYIKDKLKVRLMEEGIYFKGWVFRNFIFLIWFLLNDFFFSFLGKFS